MTKKQKTVMEIIIEVAERTGRMDIVKRLATISNNKPICSDKNAKDMKLPAENK